MHAPIRIHTPGTVYLWCVSAYTVLVVCECVWERIISGASISDARRANLTLQSNPKTNETYSNPNLVSVAISSANPTRGTVLFKEETIITTLAQLTYTSPHLGTMYSKWRPSATLTWRWQTYKRPMPMITLIGLPVSRTRQ